MELHWDILDEERRALLPELANIARDTFYLAGGTGLALQLGHRDSVDFDFFTPGEFKTRSLASEMERVFGGRGVSLTQEAKNTVSCVINRSIRCSFFTYPYPQVAPFVESEYFPIASVEDIGCMKLSAITGRSVEKDYVDLYFILKHVPLEKLLAFSKEKHPALDEGLILKSLVYFDDVTEDPILFKNGHRVTFDEVKAFLRKEVEDHFAR